LAALREAVTLDPVLQELAQSPLMLSIMSLACQGSGGNELARQKRDSPEARRKQIFGLYVEQMFQRKGLTPRAFPKEKSIGWLSWLAGKMRAHSESVFLVEGLQPGWLGTMAQRVGYGTVIALSVGLSFGLICGLAILVGVGLGCWSKSPLTNGVLSGLIGGLLVLILWRDGYTPCNFIKFLDHCARLVLLKKVGGGYIFIHRMLLDYFAELRPQPNRAEDGTAR
jgi:hypothetical protein